MIERRYRDKRSKDSTVGREGAYVRERGLILGWVGLGDGES